MAAETTKNGEQSLGATFLKQWLPPAITALIGLLTGIAMAAYNADLATNKFFLEKQAATGDSIAVEFSRYVENWSRLVRLRKQIDALKSEPPQEQRELFKKVVFERSEARDKLFSALDAAHLYYGRKASELIVQFREWDNRQAELTLDKLPDIQEWRKWQVSILRELHEEIRK